MAKYTGKKSMSGATREEGLRIAQSTQRPGQTKEQTKLIAQGIQRGIDLYKKQHKAKARDLDRRLRRAERGESNESLAQPVDEPRERADPPRARTLLPWLLLALTWLGIGAYLVFPSLRDLLGG